MSLAAPGLLFRNHGAHETTVIPAPCDGVGFAIPPAARYNICCNRYFGRVSAKSPGARSRVPVDTSSSVGEVPGFGTWGTRGTLARFPHPPGGPVSALKDEIAQQSAFTSPEEEALLNLLRTADCLQRSIQHMIRPWGITATQYNVLRILRGAQPHGLTCSA